MLTSRLLASALLLAAAAAPAFGQNIDRIGKFVQTGSNPNGALNDIAYNDKDGVYLQVWGHPAVFGRFVDADGNALGAGPFLVAQQSPSDAWPRVAYSSGSADNVFLVVFSSELGGGMKMFARTIAYSTAGPVMGGIFPLTEISATPNTIRQQSPGIVYNASRREFFVVWEDFRNGFPDVFGRAIGVNGVPKTGDINITAGSSATGQGQPNVAFDSVHGKYLAVYRGQHFTNGSLGSWGNIVDAASFAVGAQIAIAAGSGEPGEQNATYLPEVDRFFVVWTEITRVRDLLGRLVDHDGGVIGNVIPVLATSSNEGAADLEYSGGTKSVFVAAMRDATRYIQGIEVSGAGTPFNYFQATSAVPPPGQTESLYPHVANAANGRFGLSYINGFQFAWFELLQGGTACAVTLGASSALADVDGDSGALSVTGANPADCAWSASSSASWLTLSNASGTGAGAINWTAAPNTSGFSARTASISVAGQTFTVTQCGAWIAATTGDAAVGGAGGVTGFNVTIDGGACGWTASSAQSWIHGSSGTGSGTVSYTVDANTSTRGRIGRVNIGAQQYTVFQNGASGIDERIAIGVESFGAFGGWLALHGGNAADKFEPQAWTRTGWPEYNARAGGLHPAIGNVDGDAAGELIVGYARTGEGWVTVYDDANGGHLQIGEFRLPGWPGYYIANGETYPAAGDIDGDGRDEIVVGVGTGGGGWFAIFDDATTGFAFIGYRRVNWGAYNLLGDGSTHPAVGDLDGDGKAEIIIGLGTGGGGWVEVFGDGDTGYASLGAAGWFQVAWGAYNAFGDGGVWPAAGDIDGDGRAEIVLGLGASGGGWLEIKEGYPGSSATSRGWLRVNWDPYNATVGVTHPAVGNLDGDAADEIVVGLGTGGAGWLQVFDNFNGSGFPNLGFTRLALPEAQASSRGTFPAVGRLR